jgi:hypothetical protein
MADALCAQPVRRSPEQGLYEFHTCARGAPDERHGDWQFRKGQLAMKRDIDLVESRSAADLALAEADRGGAPASAADDGAKPETRQ